MKILTALQDPKTNEILKEKTKHNIIETDIQYQEGIPKRNFASAL